MIGIKTITTTPKTTRCTLHYKTNKHRNKRKKVRDRERQRERQRERERERERDRRGRRGQTEKSILKTTVVFLFGYLTRENLHFLYKIIDWKGSGR